MELVGYEDDETRSSLAFRQGVVHLGKICYELTEEEVEVISERGENK